MAAVTLTLTQAGTMATLAASMWGQKARQGCTSDDISPGLCMGEDTSGLCMGGIG